MKKNILLLLAALIPSITVTAKLISESQARLIAAEFLHGKRKIKTEVVLCNPFAETRAAAGKAGDAAFYIYNSADGKGFAIVSAEDRLPAIVGYSASGHIDGGTMSDALRLFLDSYSEYVEDIRTGKTVEASSPSLATRTRPSQVEPLVKTQWNQPAPYNKYCPDNCPAGCLAVAIAQIMKYHEWPRTGTGSSFTTYNGKALSVDFSQSEYKWEAMKNTTNELKEDAAAADAVAKLIYDCGVGAKMNYAPGGSGAFESDAGYSLLYYFGYKKSALYYDQPVLYETKEEWAEKILGEIAAERPVLLCAASSIGGGSDAAGHAFVLSGYDETSMVHVNWGWGGSSDGYYDLFRLDPGAYAFTDSQRAVYGIVPNKDGIDSDYIPVPVMAPMSTEATEVRLGTLFNINVEYVMNLNPIAAKWPYGIGLYKTDGTYIRKIQKLNSTLSLEPYFAKENMTFNCVIPESTEDGEYIIRMFFKNNNEFITPKVEGGASNNYLRVVVADGTAKIDKEPAVTAIENVRADENVAAQPEYYNISGQRISKPAAGNIFIMKQGKNVRKMIAR